MPGGLPFTLPGTFTSGDMSFTKGQCQLFIHLFQCAPIPQEHAIGKAMVMSESDSSGVEVILENGSR